MRVDIRDIITYAAFGDDLLRGLAVARGQISHFPIDLRRRPYNTRTVVRVCDGSEIRTHKKRGPCILMISNRRPAVATHQLSSASGSKRQQIRSVRKFGLPGLHGATSGISRQ